MILWGMGMWEGLQSWTSKAHKSIIWAYLGGKLMYQRDFFRIELQFSKDVEKGTSEVFPTSD